MTPKHETWPGLVDITLCHSTCKPVFPLPEVVNDSSVVSVYPSSQLLIHSFLHLKNYYKIKYNIIKQKLYISVGQNKVTERK